MARSRGRGEMLTVSDIPMITGRMRSRVDEAQYREKLARRWYRLAPERGEVAQQRVAIIIETIFQ